MKKTALIIMLFCLLAGNGFLFCGGRYDPLISDQVGFMQLPLEEQLELYFNTFRDGHTSQIYVVIAGYIVYCYGPEVIPYLKEYVNNADIFSFRIEWPQIDWPLIESNKEPDITLELVATIWSRLHLHYDEDYIRRPYAFDEIENEIQWFVDEYKRRIDEYILAVREINRTVLLSERMLYMIAGYGELEVLERYGHPNFGIPALYLRGRVLKEYYEQRLGINDLTIDYNVFQE